MNEIIKFLYKKLISKDLWKRVIDQLRIGDPVKPRADKKKNDIVAIMLSVFIFVVVTMLLSAFLKALFSCFKTLTR